jgi:Flp pilus assembly protein TadD
LGLRSDLAIALAELGNLEDARRELEAILKEDPVHPAALFNHAFISLRLGKVNMAVEDAKRLLAAEPSSRWAAEISASGKIP